MIQELKKFYIFMLLHDREILLANTELIMDLSDLRAAVLNLELKLEIESLKILLQTFDSFETEFKNRCALRALHPDYAVSFRDMPQSHTNQLYWDLAEYLFNPDNLQEMLAIVSPNTREHIQVDLTQTLSSIEQLHSSTKSRIKGINPCLIKNTHLNELSKIPATLAAFNHFVLSDEVLFDLRDISHFSLPLHAKTQKLITEHMPKLAKKIYSHNPSFRELNADISLLNNQGITPKKALKKLMQSLILGGSKFTGSYFASNPAMNELTRFICYLDSLPLHVRTPLLGLKVAEKTLEMIIKDDLSFDKCAEGAANSLKRLIDNNKNDFLLNNFTPITATQLDELLKKYPHFGAKKLQLSTQKDSLYVSDLPVKLVALILKRMPEQTLESLTLLLINAPPTWYDLIFEHITLHELPYTFKDFSIAINEGFFSHHEALAKSIAKYFHRFAKREISLQWAIKIHDPIFFYELIKIQPQSKRMELIRIFGTNDTVARMVASEPKFLKIIFESLSNNDLLELLEPRYQILYSATLEPESFKLVLKR